ncbi:MAG: PAS domain S-box protein, partial [Chloroflexi bacterium]|nr:PAS domain S-box protein [Chloroflexota bacterium]
MNDGDGEPQTATQLIVVGASAGGVEALSTLVGTLSPSLAAPILVAQHLDPSRLSHLEAILGRRSSVPVRTVRDREDLQNGVVYVVPADHHVEIADHIVSVHAEKGRSRPAPSIDRLLASAAEAYGDQLIAVILTGLGSDGADGARRVKEMGGTVVIQNPQTASHPDMPLSLAPTTVDIVAELQAIGPLLTDLLAGTYAPSQPDDDRRLRSLLEQVRSRSGIDFSTYKESTIRRRLQRRMLDTNSATLEEYVRLLRRYPEEYDRLTNSFLIKVTDFFRDADLFNHLREQVLPGLIAEARKYGSELRLWSAGCATGEEAYTLAILASELVTDDIEQPRVRIFATDLDADAIGFARRGIYPQSALKNLPNRLRDRYFTSLDGAWEVRKHVRGKVIFGQHDLGQRAPFPRIDLVLCRNVLIYFTPELQRRALQLFAFALREGGFLVLGKAETTSPLPEHFTLVQPRLKVFRRQGQRVVIPAMRIRDAAPDPSVSAPGVRPGLAGMDREVARAHARRVGGPTSAERSDQLLLELPLGLVVVDRNYDVQSINVAARRLLGIHLPGLGGDVVHLAHRALADPLRDAIDSALRGEQHASVHEVTSLPDTPGEPRFLTISSFVARGVIEQDELPESVAVLIEDVTEREREARERAVALADAESRAERTQKLLEDVTEREREARERALALADAASRAERSQKLLEESTRTVRELQNANQDLAVANTTLRNTNEELLVGNEEAMAAMEEIETLNEEQQATNEELETLNEELQATVEELHATNDDLEARTLELEEQTATQAALMNSLDMERERLDAVLASMSEAVLVVDRDGELLMTNAAFKEWFGDKLPLLLDGSGERLADRAHPARRAGQGETFTMAFTVRREDGSRCWFEASGQPLRARGVVGGVVVLRDVTERSLRHLQEEFIALAGHELRTPLTGLRSSLQLAMRASGKDAEEKRRRNLTIALNQTTLLNDLVQDLTDVVRVQSGELPIQREHIDLVQVIDESVELARPLAEGQDIRLDVPTMPLRMNADRRRLQQVLLNLIANGLQHGSSARGVDVRVRAEDDAVIIEVADYGRGIPAEHRERVFDRFYRADDQTSGSGLGIGLFLVKAIVTAHEGTIGLDSTEGHGSTFTMRLPL